MALFALEIENRNYPLANGLYLIRGRGAPISSSEFEIRIENESVEDKHAIMFADADGIAICDLGTRTGTFIEDQLLPTMIKHSIALKDSRIRFGNVDGKFIKCSLWGQHHSSGFHEESLHLELNRTTEAENLTIPETQYIIGPEQHDSTAKEDSINKNISTDTSIPETQEAFDITSTSMRNPERSVNEVQIENEGPLTNSAQENLNVEGSQFCITSQEFNGCFDDADGEITCSRDLLEDLNWMEHDGVATALKRTEKTDQPVENVKAPNIECNTNVASEHNEQSNAEQEDLLRSQTHTPDLFYVELLEKFETKEARMNTAKANRSQNEAKGISTDDDCAAQVANAKGSINNQVPSTPPRISIHVDELLDGVKTPPGEALTSPSTPKIGDCCETDVFGAEALELERDVEHMFAPPLQLSNKENMFIEAEKLADLAPTQVYVSKKAKKPITEKPLNFPENASSAALPSDLEPTQMFQPKSKSFRKTQATKNSIPSDEIDLEPTQKYLPKKLTRSATKSSATAIESVNINLNCTTKQSVSNARTSPTMQGFFPQAESEKESNPVSDSPDNAAPIMLTPEIIGNAFSEEILENISSLRAMRNRDDDSDNEDALTRLLNNRRIDNDFEILMKSIHRNKRSCTPSENGEKEYELLEKFIAKGVSKSPVKTNREEIEKRSLRRKATEPEQHEIENKRRKEKTESDAVVYPKIKSTEPLAPDDAQHSTTGTKTSSRALRSHGCATIDAADGSLSPKIKSNESSSSSVEKRGILGTSSDRDMKPQHAAIADKGDTVISPKIEGNISLPPNAESPSTSHASTARATRLKRSAAVDRDNDAVKSKFKRTEPLTSDIEQASTTRSVSNDRTGRPLKSPTKSGRYETRERSTSNSSSVSVKKNVSVEKGPKASAESNSKQTTDKRLRSKEPKSSMNEKKVQGKNEETSKRRGRSRNVPLETTSTTAMESKKSTKVKKINPEIRIKEDLDAFKPLELTPPIITSQALRTRSRTTSSASLSQEIKSSVGSEESIELPTTSRAAAKAMQNTKPKIVGKTTLKLMFTMVSPDKKLELLRHANNKWEEAQDPADSEILVMDYGNRTLKFLIAVAKGIPIVTSEWVEAIRDTGVIAVRSKYFLKDPAFEKSYKFSLLRTLMEAKKAKIFTNLKFLMTSNLTPTPNDMKAIITSAGGTVLENENTLAASKGQQLYLISSEKDRQHWHGYRRKIENLCITSTEAVMVAIMRYDAKILKTQGY